MEKEGFLLDIDYITDRDDTGKEKPVIRLWCKSKAGEDFVVLDNSFEPYFYAFLHSHFHSYPYRDIEESKRVVEKIRVDRGGDEQISVKRVEFCQKKLLGVEQRGLKIYAEHPRHVPLLRESVKKTGLTVLEADILFAIRYLIDKQLRPFDGVNVVGEEIALDYANTAILASDISYKKMGGGGDLPALKILAFDCEMATLSGYGMPSAKRGDPITIISAAYTEGMGKEVKTKLFVMEKEGWTEKGDKKVITDFLNFVAQFQPDVIVGYNSDAFDWQYIRERAKMHRIRLTVGADGSTVQYDRERGGALPGVNITGRLNVDLFKLAKRDLSSVKVKKLENVAEYLGVMKKSERVNLTPREITDYWVDASPSSAARQQLYEYAKADAVSTLGIAEKMLPLQIELSKMIGYPLDEVAKMGRGRQVEAFLTAEAYKKGELVPPKRGAEKTFEGGFVLPPEKGLHENVIALDFSSMYPTIMISFNISPDTFVETRSAEPKSDLHIAPEVGYAFRKTPDGFFKRIMSDLIARRRAIKAEMKNHDKNSDQYRLLDIQQQSIKILTNSFYGYTGWSAAKFYKRECAEATTAWGRHFIKRTVEVAEKLGFEVIYGDSVMKDTPVLIRKHGGVEIIPVEDMDIAPRTMSGGRREVKGVEVLTENGWSRVEYVHKRKTRKKTYRILTRAGFVEATEDHSFVVNGKEITPKDFKLGDRIDLVHYTLEAKYEVDDDLAWLVGFYIAEGGCGKYETKSGLKYQWKIDNLDFSLLEKCGFILNKFGLNTTVLDVRESSAVYRLVPSGNIKLFYELFKEWCHTKRGDKKIPGFILEAKRAAKESFLRGLWAGDGGKDTRTKILEISLTDKSVVAGLCAMLSSLGFEYSLGVRRDKENVIRVRMVRNKADKRLASGDVIKRIDVKEANDYVYDVETENHHFCAGVGNVLLHNTDSIFAKLPLTPDAAGKEEDIKAATWDKAREVSVRISEELPLELEIQDFFKTIFFTGKKKRYAALTDKGEIIVRGLEVRRGDWCELAKEVQTKVIELILKQKDPEAAAKYAKTVIQDVKEGKISVDKLTIYKTLTRKISSYETKQAHVMAAERALTSSSRIVYEVGSKIPYVIIKGVGKTSDRAFPVDVIERSEGDEISADGRTYQIDGSYYVQHQLIPVAHRVLQLFGYDLSSFDDMRQKTLGHWF